MTAGREELLRRVESRVERYRETREPAIVLAQDATEESSTLLAHTGWPPDAGQEVDTEAVLAVAWLHWYRVHAGSTEDADIETASALFTEVADVYPDLLPADLQTQLRPPEPGVAEYRRYQETGDPAGLDQAVDRLRETIDHTPPDDPRLPLRLANLAAVLRVRFERRGEPADADAAVAAAEQAVATTDPDDPYRAGRHSTLAAALLGRYESGGDEADLTAAAVAGAGAVDTAQPDDPSVAAYRTNLAAVALASYQRTRDLHQLDRSVAEADRASDDPEHGPWAAAIMASALTYRYDETGLVTDLDAAVEAGQSSVARTAMTTTPAIAHTNLAGALATRYARNGSDEDLTAALTHARAAQAESDPDDADHADHLATLGDILAARYESTGMAADLDEAVATLRTAVEISRRPDPTVLTNMAAALVTRHQRTGAQADLAEALTTARAAVAAAPARSAERPRALSTLALTLLDRYEAAADSAALDDAADAAEQAVTVAGPGHADAADHRGNLAAVLLTRYDRDGDPTDLSRAIALVEQGAGERSPNLGLLLQLRWEQSGASSDLDIGVALARAMVETTGPSDPARALRLTNLSSVLQVRYENLGSIEDLGDAIDRAKDASETAIGTVRAASLDALYGALQARYVRTGDRADLDETIDVARKAIRLTPAGPRLAGRLSNLSGALRSRAEQSGTADLDEAIHVARRAVDAVPDGSPSRAVLLSNLAFALADRSRTVGDAADLAEATTALRHAIAAVSAVQPARTGYLTSLALLLVDRPGSAGVDEALNLLAEATDIRTAAPLERLLAARTRGELAMSEDRTDTAATAYTAAVSLVGRISWAGLDRSSREDHLSQARGLAADAAAALLSAGRPGPAVENLELGRSSLWQDALANRTDLTELTLRAPQMAVRLAEISSSLNRRPQQDRLH